MANILKVPNGATKIKKRVGRGNASGLGVTAGKGNNGQNARSGGGVRPGFEGGQMPLYRRIARRGFSNYPFKKQFREINLSVLEVYFQDGDVVSLETLKEKKIARKNDKLVKILASGNTKKNFTIKNVFLTKGAREKLSGSTIEELLKKE